ncbi:MAG: antibiotic biosynthesis monooxygenase [Rhizobiales bacterium]|nr:antibiotic biosynthesis monooxygenase [Hyphomicrobiales bacterium]
MILEHAILDVAPERAAAYEAALAEALPLIAATPGFLGLDIHRCIETPGRYLLLVRWESVDAHEVGFRGSERYERWRALLHPFYEGGRPLVQHYETAPAAHVPAGG